MAMLPVHAVGGAAGAVGGMADSGLVIGMTRSRVWIGVLGVLLGGIVALNVIGLSLSASTSGTATKIDELERANTVTQATIAKRSSSDRIQALAAGLGLDTPTPKAVSYLKAKGGDAAAAAKRLEAGEISVLDALPIAPVFAEAAAAPLSDTAVPSVDPTAVAPVDPLLPGTAEPGAGATLPPESATAAPEAAVPDPAISAPPPSDGGVTP
ncbi:MAG: hypothetical protein WBB30_00645 [Solirubrobacterales bacterium]